MSGPYEMISKNLLKNSIGNHINSFTNLGNICMSYVLKKVTARGEISL